MGRGTGSTLLGIVSAVQRAHSQAQRAQQQRLRAEDLAQRKERQGQRARLDSIKLEMKKLEMRRRVPSPLTDQELVELAALEHALAFQFPLSPDERGNGAQLLEAVVQAQREAEEEAAAHARREQIALEIEQVHEGALRMNAQSRLMREHGLAVVLLVMASIAALAILVSVSVGR